MTRGPRGVMRQVLMIQACQAEFVRSAGLCCWGRSVAAETAVDELLQTAIGGMVFLGEGLDQMQS